MMNADPFENATSLRTRLEELRGEHRDLDQAISRLFDTPAEDELLLRRMKKRKLALKDRISAIEAMLQPNEPA
jgi:hypothetical protein